MNRLRENDAVYVRGEELYGFIISSLKGMGIRVYEGLSKEDAYHYPGLYWTGTYLSATCTQEGGHGYNWMSADEFLAKAGLCDSSLLSMRYQHNDGKSLKHKFV